MIVFDTEATDLTPGQICQLSYLMIDGGQVMGKNLFFCVDEMSEGAQEVHGMSIEDLLDLSEGRRFEDYADEIYEDFTGAGLLVGHNVSADHRYLRVEFDRLGMCLPRIKTFCTMNYFTGVMSMERRFATGRPKPPKLEELSEYFGLTPEYISEMSNAWFGGGGAAHDARYDTAATYLCLVAATQAGKLRGIL